MRGALVLLLAVLGLHCRSTGTMGPETSSQTLVFEPGAPNFNMDVVATLEDGQPGVDVYVEIPYASLVFTKDGADYAASYELLVVVYRRGERRPMREEVWEDVVRSGDYATTQTFEAVHRAERLALEPGRYVVEMRLEDAQSGAAAHRRQNVEVFSAEGDEPAASALRLEGRFGGTGFEPILGPHLPARYDSLRALVELYRIEGDVEAELLLLRFRSDTSAANPPNWLTPTPFSIHYRGIDPGRADTVQRTRRMLRDPAEVVTMEFALPLLERGSYSARLVVRRPGGEVLLEPRPHNLTVFGASFPYVASLDDMVDALVYIASDREMEDIRSAPTSEEMKARFDAFWGERLPNREAAAALLERYYSRVEEANILFSNFKEGWKTDRGMIYVVMGVPGYIEPEFQRERWYYYSAGSGMSMGGRRAAFLFSNARPFWTDATHDNYILQRAAGYDEPWRRAVERWREGRAM